MTPEFRKINLNLSDCRKIFRIFFGGGDDPTSVIPTLVRHRYDWITQEKEAQGEFQGVSVLILSVANSTNSSSSSLMHFSRFFLSSEIFFFISSFVRGPHFVHSHPVLRRNKVGQGGFQGVSPSMLCVPRILDRRCCHHTVGRRILPSKVHVLCIANSTNSSSSVFVVVVIAYIFGARRIPRCVTGKAARSTKS